MKKKFCLALDLIDDEELIKKYKTHHAPGQVWPEIVQSIKESGISNMEIFQTGNRMFMIMEVEDGFSFEKKAQMDTGNPVVQDWEELMWKFQKPLPWAKDREKWVLMDKIFDLDEQ